MNKISAHLKIDSREIFCPFGHSRAQENTVIYERGEKKKKKKKSWLDPDI